MSEYPKYGKTKRPKGGGDPIWLFENYIVTHKVDGTNARLCWNGSELEFGSRKQLVTPDNDNYGFASWANENINEELFKEHFSDVSPVVVFGEFFSGNIQKRVAYPVEPQFVVFDVFINSKYLDWDNVVDVTNKLNLDIVHYERCMRREVLDKEGQLKDESYYYIDPYALNDADKSDKIGEGIVIRPEKELVEPYGSQYGTRLIRKIKSKKFEEVNKKSSNSGAKNQYPQKEVDKVLKYVTKNRIFSVLETFKENNPSITFDREITGDVIKNTFSDMKAESDEELNEEIMSQVAGNKIANLYFEMLEDGYLP